MAKQTINIGASPNDGTGTPLRTSFDYCNQNFTELYTSLGGGTGLPGLNGEVIFNNGTSLAGDPAFVFDAATDMLSVTGFKTFLTTQLSTIGTLYVGTLATPKLKVDVAGTGITTITQADITGDLTVATDRLKVVTGSTAVQIGSTTQTQFGTTAWPSDLIAKANSRVLVGNLGTVLLWNESAAAIGNASNLFIGAKSGAGATTFGGSYISSGIENASDRAGFFALSTFQSNGVDRERYRIDSTGVHTWQYVGNVAGTAMTLNSTGLGVGVTPSAWFSTWKVLQLAGGTFGGPSDRSFSLQNAFVNTSGQFQYISASSTPASAYRQLAGAHDWYTAAAGTSPNQITDFSSPKMTLDASGKLLVGQTSVGEDGIVSIKGTNGLGVEATANGGSTFNAKYSGTGTGYFGYFKYGGTLVGTIASTGAGNCTFNQVSDYRLKEAVQPLVGGLARILALKPSVYKWKANGSAGEGFLAHELAESIPFAVTGEKDAVAQNGEINPQQVDLSKVVPVLVAAIKELAAEVNALKNA